ncbi:uncharacterized protein EAE97_003084 [Botrytis byssoidea]|uniref:Uncharacterized protein n=1 Tax=Botrytis byssoidea TaxID=139641 RepID=A0A9P5IT97_9HELO|nr:uncharacterized protein EAE97_003084 [Botrytis byssoidea]KAF7949575.1 hypothetical protein EAE97_003084 [Botrytis byssoidea]
MISIAPKLILLDVAKFLDDERIRGSLHGIPVTEAQDPVGTVPLGYSQTNGRPFRLAAVASG